MIHKMPLGFIYDTEHWRDGELLRSQRATNVMPQVSVDFIAGLIRGTGPLLSNWYMGLFQGNFVPDGDTTASDLPSPAEEFTGYDEESRPPWVHEYDGVAVISNVTNRATFTVSADRTVYGGFIISTNTKGGNTGRLLSIARFPTADDLRAGDEFRVAAGIALVPTIIS